MKMSSSDLHSVGAQICQSPEELLLDNRSDTVSAMSPAEGEFLLIQTALMFWSYEDLEFVSLAMFLRQYSRPLEKNVFFDLKLPPSLLTSVRMAKLRIERRKMWRKPISLLYC